MFHRRAICCRCQSITHSLGYWLASGKTTRGSQRLREGAASPLTKTGRLAVIPNEARIPLQAMSGREKHLSHHSVRGSQQEAPHLIANLTSRQPRGWSRSDSKDRTSRSPAARLPAGQTELGFPGPLRLAPYGRSRPISNNCTKPGAAASGPSTDALAASAAPSSPPPPSPPVPRVPRPDLPRFALCDSDATGACALLPRGQSLAAQTHKPVKRSPRCSRPPKPEIISNRRAILSTPFPSLCRICGTAAQERAAHVFPTASYLTERPVCLRSQLRRACTGLRNTPTPATETSTVSPPSRAPTPAGVPVAITSPGISVIIREIHRSRNSTGYAIREVFPD